MVAGPTASGKTSLSLLLADQVGGLEIVSADSRQVYRGMDIGTAKVAPSDRARVPHHGLDLVDPDEPFSVARYARTATSALGSISGRGRAALLVGGTGLYLRAVTSRLEFPPASSDPMLRARLDRRLEEEGLATLADELRDRAPRAAAHTDQANPRRVVRALERVALLGDVAPPAPRGYPGRVLWLGLDPGREEARRRVEQRVRAQFAGGLIEEAAMLLERYPTTLRAFSAVAYREAMAVVRGELATGEAIEQTITRTHRYVRRQRTWFRGEAAIEWLVPSRRGEQRAVELVERFLRSGEPSYAPAGG